MFITDEAHKSPLSYLRGNKAESFWEVTELALRQPWYLVTFTQHRGKNKKAEVGRTLLLCKVGDVETLINLAANEQLQCESIMIVTPKHINCSDTWKMEPLSAVWRAEEPTAPGQMVDIFETLEGALYARSALGTPLKRLRNKSLRFRVSAS